MTNTGEEQSQLAIRRRKIIYRAWHRGIREMDLVLGQYIDAHIAIMDEKSLDAFEEIMSLEDRDLLTYVTGEMNIPKTIDTPLFRDIINYRSRMDFSV